MIYVGTKLSVVDNSGASQAQCIRLYKNSKKAVPGSIILVSLKKVRPNSKIKKGQVFKALVIRSNTYVTSYLGGHLIFSDTNSVVLLKKNGDILGSRFKGPVWYKICEKASLKPLSLTTLVY